MLFILRTQQRTLGHYLQLKEVQFYQKVQKHYLTVLIVKLWLPQNLLLATKGLDIII